MTPHNIQKIYMTMITFLHKRQLPRISELQAGQHGGLTVNMFQMSEETGHPWHNGCCWLCCDRQSASVEVQSSWQRRGVRTIQGKWYSSWTHILTSRNTAKKRAPCLPYHGRYHPQSHAHQTTVATCHKKEVGEGVPNENQKLKAERSICRKKHLQR